MQYFVHQSSIVSETAIINAGVKIWHFSHVMNNAYIGCNVTLGQNVMIGEGVVIGSGSKIQNNVSVYSGVVLEENVFCGPSCVFTNVATPRAFINRKSEFGKIRVRKGATIGANATLVAPRQGHCLDIGEFSFIAAGSVVTRDVPNYGLAMGVPARLSGWVSRAGEVLRKDLKCPRTQEEYYLKNGVLFPA
ncbi:acetyltransferase [Woodsholea maritima]|uniref:acetyltransferase n=1 Tax=Woodsholea maritima TaxID=240237 RepID=UPI000A0387E6|nr:acyltransferase [Woodsholea maritima]